MQKVIRIILGIIGTLLILNVVWLIVVSNINTGIVVALALGLILIVISILWKKIINLTNQGIGRILKYIVLIVFIVWSIFLLFIIGYGKADNVTYNEDAVIVLGCGIRGKNVSATLSYRLDKAIEYYNKNLNAIIVVSGGKGPQEEITEAEAMEKYLIERGIPKEKIIKEENSTSTTENMRYSKKILDEKFDKEYKTVIITNNFHIYRANQIAKKTGLNTAHYNARVRWDTVVTNYIRETIGVAKYWILGE